MDKDTIYRILIMTLVVMLGCYLIYAAIDLMVATLYFMMTKPLYALGLLVVTSIGAYFISSLFNRK